MKTYKLIKTYPGSPNLGAIVNLADFITKVDFDHHQFYIDEYPLYWELQEDKDHEILSYYNTPYSNMVIFKFNEFGECLSRSDCHSPAGTVNLSKGNFLVHSVKRLSDGEIFTIGDFCNGAPIEEIWFCDTGHLRFSASENGGYCQNLKSMEHQVFFSFTTNDGVVLHDKGDRVFGVLPKGSWQTNYYGGDGICIDRVLSSKTGELRTTAWKWFSTKIAAENYIHLNKPTFSWGDIFRVFPSMCIGYSTQYLKFKSIEDEKTGGI